MASHNLQNHNGGLNKHTQGLVASTLDFIRLLHAADTFPRGGLFSGYYALQAALRYEHVWLKMQARDKEIRDRDCKPPLDVAVAWLVHRQNPERFVNYCLAVHSNRADPSAAQAFAFGCFSRRNQRHWDTRAGGDQPAWPPPRPGSPGDLTRVAVQPHAQQHDMAGQLAVDMQRFGGLLHSFLRPQFLDRGFLDRAAERYARFLQLHAAHPDAPLVPTADIALLWHTHLGLSESYAAMCGEVFGTKRTAPWAPAYLTMAREQLAQGYSTTARLWWEAYGSPYDGPDTAWVALGVPHPLAAPTSPLAHVLARYDEADPRDAAALAKAEAAARERGAKELRFEPGAVPHSGAHALFAAWLATKAFSDELERSCCKCLVSKRALRRKQAKRAGRYLAGLRYFHRLPSYSWHPYLLAIQHRVGGWSPTASHPQQHQGIVTGTPVDVPTTAEPHTSLSSSSTGVSSGDPKADPTATGDGGGGPKGARRRSRDRLRGVDPRHPYYGAGGADAPLILFPMCFWYLGYTEAAPEAWSSMGGDPAHMYPPASGFGPEGVESYMPDLAGAGAALGMAGAAADVAGGDGGGLALLGDPGFRSEVEGGFDATSATADATGGQGLVSFTGMGGLGGDPGAVADGGGGGGWFGGDGGGGGGGGDGGGGWGNFGGFDGGGAACGGGGGCGGG